MQYFKTAVLRRKADCNGLVLIPAQLLSKKRADNPHLMANGLSALRLCVWLFDNGYIELFYMDQGFLPTFRTE